MCPAKDKHQALTHLYLMDNWNLECNVLVIVLNRGSYMSASVLMNLLKEQGKEIKNIGGS